MTGSAFAFIAIFWALKAFPCYQKVRQEIKLEHHHHHHQEPPDNRQESEDFYFWHTTSNPRDFFFHFLNFFSTFFNLYSTCDLWHLRHQLQYWQLRTWNHDNLCSLTINCDTGQHSQFLRCLLMTCDKYQVYKTYRDMLKPASCMCNWLILSSRLATLEASPPSPHCCASRSPSLSRASTTLLFPPRVWSALVHFFFQITRYYHGTRNRWGMFLLQFKYSIWCGWGAGNFSERIW